MSTETSEWTDQGFDRFMASLAATVAVGDVIGEAQRERQDPERWVPFDEIPFAQGIWRGGVANIPVPEIALRAVDPSKQRRIRWVTVPIVFFTEGTEVVHISSQGEAFDQPEITYFLFTAIQTPLSGAPRRPRRIITDDERFASALGVRSESGCALDFATVEVRGIDKARWRAVKLFMERMKAALHEEG